MPPVVDWMQGGAVLKTKCFCPECTSCLHAALSMNAANLPSCSLTLFSYSVSCRYPAGYSLVFIPYYSPVYTGSHWGVYDQDQNFYGYDDGDVSGELCLQWHTWNPSRTHAA